jgi:hypothetical protein
MAGQAGAGTFSPSGFVSGAKAYRWRAKTIANALRELDRFLNILADETAKSLGYSLPEGQRNTANKLRDFEPFAIPWEDYERLVALERSGACLFYCDGRVSSGDRRGGLTFTAGWPPRGGPVNQLSRMTIGDRLVVEDVELHDIAEFYRRLAMRLGALADEGSACGNAVIPH